MCLNAEYQNNPSISSLACEKIRKALLTVDKKQRVTGKGPLARTGMSGSFSPSVFDRFTILPLIFNHTHKSLAKWSKEAHYIQICGLLIRPMCHINFLLLNLHPFNWDCRALRCDGVQLHTVMPWQRDKKLRRRQTFPLLPSTIRVVFCQWYDYIDLGWIWHYCMHHSLRCARLIDVSRLRDHKSQSLWSQWYAP